jgi:hypothetical protein
VEAAIAILDDFNRATEALDASGNWDRTSGLLVVDNNEVQATVGSGAAEVGIWNADTLDNTQTCSVEIDFRFVGAGTNTFIEAILTEDIGFTHGVGNAYLFGVQSNGQVFIDKYTSGTGVTLFSQLSAHSNAGRMRGEWDTNGDLRVYLDDVLFGGDTDTDFVPVYAGIDIVEQVGAAGAIDNFAAGPLN